MAAAVAGYLSNEIVNDLVEELGQNIYGRDSCQDSLFLNCGEFFIPTLLSFLSFSSISSR